MQPFTVSEVCENVNKKNTKKQIRKENTTKIILKREEILP